MSRARLIPSILRTTTVVAAAACLFGLQSPGAHARPTVPFAPVCALDGPTDGAAFNQSGSDIFYVADTQNHQVILLSDAFGCSAFVIGSEGSGDGQLSQPQGVAVDADGFIYVSDTGNDRVQKFDNLDGLDPGDEVSFLQVFVGGVALDEPMGMGANDLGHIFVADTGNDRIVVYATDGSLIDTFGEEDDGDSQTNGEFIEPVDVAACDSTTPGFGARIFVLDRGRDNVQVFDEDRDFLFSFSSQGSGLGQLSSPGGIATDHRCAVYIADTGNDRIQMFDADGGFLEVLGGGNDPTGIAVSGGGAAGPTAGGVYIVNTGGDGIDAFEFIDYDTDDDGLIDSDGDGLPDIWEEDGIDIGFDGTTDLDLPGLGADPDHKNLFMKSIT